MSNAVVDKSVDMGELDVAVVSQSQSESPVTPCSLIGKFKERCQALSADTGPVTYTDLSEGEGHSQGDVRIQFMGKDWDFGREAISTGEQTIAERGMGWLAMPKEVVLEEDSRVSLDEGGDAQGHYILNPQKLELYSLRQLNPLTSFAINVPEGEQLHVAHEEHRDAIFTQPGWYVSRLTRARGTSEAALASELVRVVD